ncbi:MAG: Crp/Fnr family transcriptional regulator [Xanthobacteraceae bacterium]|uniref:Crp/Fnr family transcriptional regulator n=1 Tax=Pseudolabrys sp. TaxID=1960880 RepID=UPI003D11760D
MDIALSPTTGNRLLASFPADLLELARRDMRTVSLAQGRVLYEVGAPVDTIYFPQTGLISLLIVTEGGGMIEATTVGREGAVGLHAALGRRLSFTRVNVQIGGSFVAVPVSRFAQHVAGNKAAHDVIMRYTEVLWAESQQTSACNAAHDASSRLCRWLLQSADRVGSNDIPLTQEFLAQMLGVRRTTVTLLAQTMQDKGLISYSRGRITLLDRDEVEKCACECYGAMRRDRLLVAIGIEKT